MKLPSYWALLQGFRVNEAWTAQVQHSDWRKKKLDWKDLLFSSKQTKPSLSDSFIAEISHVEYKIHSQFEITSLLTQYAHPCLHVSYLDIIQHNSSPGKVVSCQSGTVKSAIERPRCFHLIRKFLIRWENSRTMGKYGRKPFKSTCHIWNYTVRLFHCIQVKERNETRE